VIFPSEQDFALLLFQLFILLSLALGLGELLRRFGHPTVIGEILAGVLLGPSILGTLAPQISGALFQDRKLSFWEASRGSAAFSCC
jgi:Kef-type K+ transport system membrane component KefB